MNKLQEIIEQSYVRIFNGDYDKNYEDTVKETIKEACVEYARSKVPEKVEDFSNEDNYADIYTGHNECIDMFISSIDQDLQSLND